MSEYEWAQGVAWVVTLVALAGMIGMLLRCHRRLERLHLRVLALEVAVDIDSRPVDTPRRGARHVRRGRRRR